MVAPRVDDRRTDPEVGERRRLRLLEPAATGLAALRATDRDIVALNESLHALTTARGSSEIMEFDLEFHHKVASVTGNAT